MSNWPARQSVKLVSHEGVGSNPTTPTKIIINRDVAQLARALRLGRRGRRFESCYPYYYLEV